MIKKIFGNTPVKRAIAFTVVFTLTGVLMGNSFVGVSDVLYRPVYAASVQQEAFHTRSMQTDDDAQQVWAPEYGANSDFAAMVQAANKQEDFEPRFSLFSEMDEQTDLGHAQFVYLPSIPLSKELQEFTWQRCQELDIEYELVLAIMWRESRFKTNAVGYNNNGTRDSGVMQINDINKAWLKKELGITDLMDPYQNITAGTAMLADYLHEYDDESKALMAYHCGEAGMRKQASLGVTTNRQVKIAQEKRDIYKSLTKSI